MVVSSRRSIISNCFWLWFQFEVRWLLRQSIAISPSLTLAGETTRHPTTNQETHAVRQPRISRDPPHKKHLVRGSADGFQSHTHRQAIMRFPSAVLLLALLLGLASAASAEQKFPDVSMPAATNRTQRTRIAFVSGLLSRPCCVPLAAAVVVSCYKIRCSVDSVVIHIRFLES